MSRFHPTDAMHQWPLLRIKEAGVKSMAEGSSNCKSQSKPGIARPV